MTSKWEMSNIKYSWIQQMAPLVDRGNCASWKLNEKQQLPVWSCLRGAKCEQPYPYKYP